MKTVLTIITLTVATLSGCTTHQWTAEELAALKAERARCGEPSMIGAEVWCKESGEPLPAILFLPARGARYTVDQ